MARYDDLYVLETATEPRPVEQPSVARRPNGEKSPGRTIHRYGRLNIVSEVDHESPTAVPKASDFEEARNSLKDIERLGLAALRLLQSEGFIAARTDRPRAGERWDMPGCTTVVPTPTSATHRAAALAPPTSAYLEGSVAVGIIIVQGPTAALQFTDDERTTVVAEVQNGLGSLASAKPLAGVSFRYDIQTVTLPTQPDPTS
ncbi:hypothetical protein M2271_005940 [Streptomyces sp. LBL]|uniref:hypothetical protein n=1 Tax=Streptomyces sp. LBL TaxID=2940562 RepID=UPI00247675EF|nr:hypothetical protein [Streptomyces sp. LBL]MDH6628108.1 hypothetical protein [Streptomyces sp. LBL]